MCFLPNHNDPHDHTHSSGCGDETSITLVYHSIFPCGSCIASDALYMATQELDEIGYVPLACSGIEVRHARSKSKINQVCVCRPSLANRWDHTFPLMIYFCTPFRRF